VLINRNALPVTDIYYQYVLTNTTPQLLTII